MKERVSETEINLRKKNSKKKTKDFIRRRTRSIRPFLLCTSLKKKTICEFSPIITIRQRKDGKKKNLIFFFFS